MSFLQDLQYYPEIYLTTSFILGLLIGSFLNVVVYRLPKIMENEWRTDCIELLEDEFKTLKKQTAEAEPFNLAVPASRCPSCSHKISALENIPVISYLVLKGACKSCKNPISMRYPLIEFITGILTFFAVYYFGFTLEALAACIFTWCLIALFLIDMDTYYLPDSIVFPLLWLGLFLSTFNVFVTPKQSIIGAIVGYLSLWIFAKIYGFLTKKDAMGHGDFKLLAVFGAWFGWMYLPQIILMSTFVGAVLGISMIIFFKREKQKPIPFGPYLAVAAWIALYWGEQINTTYLKISGLQ